MCWSSDISRFNCEIMLSSGKGSRSRRAQSPSFDVEDCRVYLINVILGVSDRTHGVIGITITPGVLNIMRAPEIKLRIKRMLWRNLRHEDIGVSCW